MRATWRRVARPCLPRRAHEASAAAAFPVLPHRVLSNDLVRPRRRLLGIFGPSTFGFDLAQRKFASPQLRGQPRLATNGRDEPAKGTRQPGSVAGGSPPVRPPRPLPKPPHGPPCSGLRPDFNGGAVVEFLRGSDPREVQMSLDDTRAAPGREARARQTASLTLASPGREPSALSDAMLFASSVKAGSAERGLWRSPDARMASESSNLADESKPAAGVASI
jgi:hypothetical protein